MVGIRGLAAFIACVIAAPASAHSFGRVYTLPVPVWMYLYGAAAALAVSFVIIGYFVTRPSTDVEVAGLDLSRLAPFRAVLSPPAVALLRALAVGALALCIVSGFVGTDDAYKNINMTLFWVVFILGFAYLTALIGNGYACINPWKTLVRWIERAWHDEFRGRFAYPRRLGHLPALAFYVLFIWIELFGEAGPRELSWMLAVYTLINLTGAWLWGSSAWFRYCEFFAVFLRLIALAAPVAYSPPADPRQPGRLKLVPPFQRLLKERAEGTALLIFVLFMLSSTAFDGLHETLPWVNLFWLDIYPTLAKCFGSHVSSLTLMKGGYAAFNTIGLLLSPFFYLAIYVSLVWLARRLTSSDRDLRQLLRDFCFPLIPIALVYHVTHYYTLIVSQGQQIFRLISDPFGWGWNLFGTAQWKPAIEVVDASFVWHSQVALILAGHIVSVYLAHIVALRVFPNHRSALISQLPMLVLMVAYTTIGLWILSQPLSGGG